MFTIIGDPSSGGGNDTRPPDEGGSPGSGEDSGEGGAPGSGGNDGGNLPGGGGSSPPKDIPEVPASRIGLLDGGPFSITAGQPFSLDFSQYVTWTGLSPNIEMRYYAVNSALPLGLSFNGSVISGSTTTLGSRNVTIGAYAAIHENDFATKEYTFNVNAPELNIRSIGTGLGHTCAVTYENQLWCWGELLTVTGSTGNDVLSPVYTNRSNVLVLSTGSGYSNCFSTTSNNVTCIGNIADVRGTKNIANVTKIVTGKDFACALTSEGAVKCWGVNNSGQLGNGRTTTSSSPVNAINSGVVDIAAGLEHACAAMDNGDIKCWGKNDSYQAGEVNYGKYNSIPTVVANLPGLTLVSAGNSHSCAVAGGQVYCWGSHNLGQLGIGNGSHKSSPSSVSLRNVTSISSGENHTCAVSSRSIYCWGHGSSGQLGFTATSSQNSPRSVTGANQVAAGKNHTCGLSSNALRCWGNNSSGQIGKGAITSEYRSPQLVPISL